MSVCCIGLSQYGKSHLCKELIKKLQDETPRNIQTIVMCLVSFPDEFKVSEKQNSDKEIYIRPGNKLEIYDKGKGDYKQQLQKLCNHAFNPDIKNKYKIVFIDDQTTDMNNKEPLLTKLYSEGRHSYIQLIQCLHYLNSIHVNNKAHIRDFILFGGQIYSKLKDFYIDLIGQHFNTQNQNENYENYENEQKGQKRQKEQIKDDVNNFIQLYNDFISGGLDPDDPDREKYFHNAFQISLPTKQDARALMVEIYPDKQYELIETKNAIWKLLQRDLEKRQKGIQ